MVECWDDVARGGVGLGLMRLKLDMVLVLPLRMGERVRLDEMDVLWEWLYVMEEMEDWDWERPEFWDLWRIDGSGCGGGAGGIGDEVAMDADAHGRRDGG